MAQGHMLRRYERRESRRKKRSVVGEALEVRCARCALRGAMRDSKSSQF